MSHSHARRAAFGLGSNMGDRIEFLQLAVDEIAADPNVELVAVSSVYETDPVGGPDQRDFLNAVLVADVTARGEQLLELAKRCERKAGRVRAEHWGPRTLDVDILAVAGLESTDPTLTLPHPAVGKRAFVLVPWAEVDPDFAVAAGTTVSSLLLALSPDELAEVRLTGQRLQVA